MSKVQVSVPLDWAKPPTYIPPECPPGLEYLHTVDQVLVKQQIELLEIITDWETKNKYQIIDPKTGQQIYFAAEESECCMRQCGGSDRGFVMHITDNQNREVFRAHRECQCCVGCCCCIRGDTCAYQCNVDVPIGNQAGRIRQSFSWWSPKMEVLDADDKPLFRIAGPCCLCQAICCTNDLDFVITDVSSGAEIGKIGKKWDGIARDLFTDADTFGVSFPLDLDVKKKALLIGAVFHVDFLYFEDDGDNNN